MVALVLTHASVEALELQPHAGPGRILCLDGHGDVPLDRHEHSLERETAFVVDLGFIASRDDCRVDECDRAFTFNGLEDEQAPEHTDLGRSETDPARALHESRHPLDEVKEVLVEVLDHMGVKTKNRVGVLPDLGQRDATARFALGIVFGIVLSLVLGPLLDPVLLFDSGFALLGHGASVLTA